MKRKKVIRKTMGRIAMRALHFAWGSLNEYQRWLNSKSIEESVEIIILTLRDAIQPKSYEIQGSELYEKDIRKNWLPEILQKDEFLELAKKEAIRRKNPQKENFKIAVEAVSVSLRNVYKDMDWRGNKGKRTYAKPELIALISSLPFDFENEKVSKKTLKLLGFVDVEEETNLDIYAELYQKHKQQAQKTFLLSNLIEAQKKKRKKRKKSSGSSSSAPAAQQLSLI